MQPGAHTSESEAGEAISRLKAVFWEKGAGSRQYLQALKRAQKALRIGDVPVPVEWTSQELREGCHKLVERYRQSCYKRKEMYKAKKDYGPEYEALYKYSRSLYESIRILLEQPNTKPFIYPLITKGK